MFVISMGAAIALSCDVTYALWAKTIIVVDYTIIILEQCGHVLRLIHDTCMNIH
jgi:hypothetical protein